MMSKVSWLELCLSLILLMFANHCAFALSLDDVSQINTTSVTQVIHVHNESDIMQAVRIANRKHLPIAIMGKQHSQGGQSLAPNAIELDMLSFNKILNLDVKRKQITVQSGITWQDIQKFINSYNLAITAMQSPNIFTVGGSVSVNAHGEDFRVGSLSNSIVAFDLVLANGKKLHVTYKNNPTLWSAVIGGYGLIGIITNVTLQLTDNNLLVSHYHALNLNNFTQYFQDQVLNNKNIALFFARLSIAPGNDFLQDMYAIDYYDTHTLPQHIVNLTNPNRWNAILTPVFNISRRSSLGKTWRWRIEKRILNQYYNGLNLTRNNAMNVPINFALMPANAYQAYWLQEYFIPIEQLKNFIPKLRNIMLENKVNLLNVTIRYVPAQKGILMPYANKNCFSIVLYFKQELTASAIENTKNWTRKLIGIAQFLNGNYYLTYQNFASQTQFRRAYPGYSAVIKIKKDYDPGSLLTNKFYLSYFK